MKIGTILLSAIAITILSTSAVQAAAGSPVAHSHNGRSHSHSLPATGKNHTHGKKPIERKANSGLTQFAGKDVTWLDFMKGVPLMALPNPSASVKHSHGSRSHNHILPKSGTNHSHSVRSQQRATYTPPVRRRILPSVSNPRRINTLPQLSTGGRNYCKVASYTFLGLMDRIEKSNPNYRIGEAICKSGGSSSCFGVSSVGEGICKSSGSTSCFGISNAGEGICKASGSTSCFGVSNIGEGICKASGSTSCFGVSSIGEGICKASGSASCYGTASTGEGICKASGNASCYGVSTMGEGICKASGNLNCYGVNGLVEGICKASQVGNCSGLSLEQALCKSAGLSNCSNVSFTQILTYSIARCGSDILYKVR